MALSGEAAYLWTFGEEMESTIEIEKPRRHPITAGRLVAAFFMCYILSALCRTPGSWSDGRSQWMPELLQTLIVIPFLVLVHWIFVRPTSKDKIHRSILWLVFGGFGMLAIIHLISSQSFLESYGYPGPIDYLRSPTRFLNAPWGHF